MYDQLLIGQCHERLQQTRKAKKMYQKVMEEKPDMFEPKLRLGTLMVYENLN